MWTCLLHSVGRSALSELENSSMLRVTVQSVLAYSAVQPAVHMQTNALQRGQIELAVQAVTVA
jgi:hypothetical protein